MVVVFAAFIAALSDKFSVIVKIYIYKVLSNL